MSGSRNGVGIHLYCSCCSVDEREESGDERQHLLSHSNSLESNVGGCRKNMGKLCCSVCTGVSGVVFLLIGIIVACLFDPLVNSYIDKEIQITNDTHSEMYKTWVEPPIVPYLKIYFFNLTNSDEFLMNKTKPIFNQVGPYSYKEKWRKVNVSFHDNGTVTYETKKEYFFVRSLSSGPEEDIIHTLNVPVTVAVERISHMSKVFQLLISSLLITLNETAFIDKSVKDLIWGYEDPLLKIAKKYLPKNQQLPFDKFGFFYQRNGSTDGLLNVYTGVQDISKLFMIDNFDHSHSLPYWDRPDCNMINGTDGTLYPPYVKKTSTLYMFNKNLCRSISLEFNNTIKHEGYLTYRFTPPADIFASVSEKPDNLCYCVGGPPCIGGGLFNISACTFNVSTLLSWPHFYQADPKYLDAVVGLEPDPDKHSFYIDVNPRLGTPMGAQARFQVNFFTSNSSTIKIMSNMTQMVFPVLWFEDGVTKLPSEVIHLIGLATYMPKVIKAALLSIVSVLFAILFALTVISCCMHKRSQSKMILAHEDTKYSSSKSTSGGHVNHTVSAENPD